MSTSEIYSQASNFLGFVKTGVDPRTGQFTLAMSLPLAPANHLTGPSLSPTLAFNSLASTHDSGFGLGWSLNLSTLTLTPQESTLSLVSGEHYAVDWENSDVSVGGKLMLLDQKVQTLIATRMSDDCYRIDLKSGTREILKQQDNDSVYRLCEMHSPEGRRLFIDWLPFGNGNFVPERIRDENRVLMQFIWQSGELHIINNPDSEERSVIRLLLSNNRLSSVYLPDIDQPFSFSYEAHAVAPGTDLLFPDRVSGPLGASDTVQWATGDAGHQLPEGAPIPFLPRVAGWTHGTGPQGPELHRTYEWIGDHNFLGFGSDQAFDWQQGRDNLYQVERDYEYEVIESQRGANDESVITITRTWNRFHLPTREVSRQGACEVRIDTLYGLDPDLTWEQQPAWCQLPHTIATTYTDHSRVHASRCERTEYSYDDYGNVLQVSYPDGIQEDSEYYPADGEQGCPPDPLGMVRYLKRKTVTPAPGREGDVAGASIISTLYTYEKLDSLLADGPAHTVVSSEQARDETHDLVLETTWQTYVRTRDAHYGRDACSVNLLSGKATTTAYRYELIDDHLITHTSVQGFENDAENRSVTRDSLSVLTGLVRQEHSEAGQCTGYEYDALGRVVRTVIAQGSAHEGVRTARYHIADTISHALQPHCTYNPVMIEQTDVTGQRKRSWLDGAGRTVRIEMEDLDQAPGTFREIAGSVYDPSGRVIRQTSMDWLPGDTPPLTLVTHTAYDDWGHVAQVRMPTGVIQHTLQDPVLLRTEQWQQSASKRGPRTVTLTDVCGRAIEQQVYDEADGLVRTTRLIRDGLGRVIEQRESADGQTEIVTRTRYDAYSRVIERQLADATLISWTFASHSDAEHAESIAVTPAQAGDPMTSSTATVEPTVIGRQRFDGLGRPRTFEVGGRVTCSHYVPGQLPPSATTLADGKQIAFTYQSQSGNSLLSIEPANETAHRITYDPLLGQPVSATGELGRQHWTYTASGQPETDIWKVDGEEHVTRWNYSLNGLLLGLRDAQGTLHERGYDAVGRLQRLDVGAVQTFFTYDDFSRPATLTTRDPSNDRQLSKTLTYDALGREHTCTFELLSGGAPRTVIQTMNYNALDQLVSRIWQDGEQRGEETYAYDLRGRLVRYTANDAAAPADPFGNRIVRQVFTLNALDGYERVVSHFADGSQDEAVFTYAPNDPTQVMTITHSHTSWPARISLRYDACGRVIEDSLGRSMTWDTQDRLTSVSYNAAHCRYRYDPSGNLTDRQFEGRLSRSFFSSRQMTHEQRGAEQLTLIGDGDRLFALSKLSKDVRQVILIGTDAQGSVRLEDDGDLISRRYTPHGAQPVDGTHGPFGFAGQRTDDLTGWSIPGGYRPYDPILMSFLSPDSESPFGRGGANPYAYCGGDPINRTDPDGHSWVTWVVAGTGLALGTVAMLASFGAAAPAVAALYTAGMSTLTASGAMAIGAATLSAISLGTGIASVALEAVGNHEKAASILGWVSLGTGLASTALELAPIAIGRLAARAGRSPGRAAASRLQRTGSIQPPKRLGYAEIIFEKNPGSSDVAFLERLWGQDTAALVTHGSPFGQLMNAHGKADSALNIANNLIGPRLTAIGYPANREIVLLACWGGKSGAAQTIADALKRPVQAFGTKIYLPSSATLQLPARVTGKLHGAGTTVPVYKINVFKRIFASKRGPFTDAPGFAISQPKMYYPR